MQRLPKFTGEHQRELENDSPGTGTNRCPRCRYKKTVVASGIWRFCTLCSIQWQHVYFTEHFKAWTKARFGGSSSSPSRSS